MKENKVKRALKEGKVSIGTLIDFVRTPAIATMMKAIGFDWIVVDSEHSGFSMETIADITQMARGADIVPIVRVPTQHYDPIYRYLDAGALGLLIPRIEERAVLERIMRETKYYPTGERGMSPQNAHSDFVPWKNVMQDTAWLNEETMTVLLIESKRAVDNLEDLLQVKGIDVAHVGVFDLSQALGRTGDIQHPEVITCIEQVIKVCNKMGVAPGLSIFGDVEGTKRWVDKGIRFINYGHDTGFLYSVRKSVQEIQEYIGKR
jgi:4-hydroxy-2-oxoheptanedioate aldolase